MNDSLPPHQRTDDHDKVLAMALLLGRSIKGVELSQNIAADLRAEEELQAQEAAATHSCQLRFHELFVFSSVALETAVNTQVAELSAYLGCDNMNVEFCFAWMVRFWFAGAARQESIHAGFSTNFQLPQLGQGKR